MTDPTQALAELRRVTPPNSPWEAGDIGVGSSPVDYHIATILNAALSGDLIPRAEADLAVALMVEEACYVLDTAGDSAVTDALGQRLCCSGQDCGCHGADVGTYLIHLIRSEVAPASALAELQALRDDVTGWISNAQVAREKWSEYEARAEAAEADITTYQKIVADMTQEAETDKAELAALRAQVEKMTAKLALVQRALEKADEGLEYMGLYAPPSPKEPRYDL